MEVDTSLGNAVGSEWWTLNKGQQRAFLPQRACKANIINMDFSPRLFSPFLNKLPQKPVTLRLLRERLHFQLGSTLAFGRKTYNLNAV